MPRLLAAIVLGFPLAAFGQLQPEAPPELVDSLTARVHGFYELFQQGQFRQGEAYVDDESQDLYYNVRKVRIMGHEIKNINWEDDFRTARVTVTALTLVPMLGSKPLPVPVGSEWRLRDSEWFMHLTEPESGRKTPFGQVDPNASASTGNPAFAGVPQGQGSAPAPANFQRMISLAEYSVSFPSESGEPLSHEIQITSRAPVGLSLRMGLIRSAPDGLTVSVEPPRISSGESSRLKIDYDASVHKLVGDRSLDFAVEPSGQRIRVKLTFQEAEQPGDSAAQ